MAITAAVFALVLGGCAAPLRYVDQKGTEYSGTLSGLSNSMSADIDGKHYQGHYKTEMWGWSRATLRGPANDELRCQFVFAVQKVKDGTCIREAGGEYKLESR